MRNAKKIIDCLPFAAHVSRGNRGSVMIMVAVALLALTSIAAVAIDSSVMLATRTQLQVAADAAALAGASGLIDGDQILATTRAIDYASFNSAMLTTGSAPVVITDADVTFPAADIVRVTTHRTMATGDPLRMFFRRVVDPAVGNQADVTAVAAAQAFDVCASRCVKPWSVPDRWGDTDGDGEFDADEVYDPEGTGYVAPNDVGAPIVLKVGSPQGTIAPGIYFPICLPPIDSEYGSPLTGAAWYREWIAECCPFPVEVGDRLLVEPGNMVGPTRQGVEDLIALDPNARWDNSSNTIVSSDFGRSPRIVLVPFFDPTLPPQSGRNEVTITKIGAFFLEDTAGGGDVIGRYIGATTAGLPCEGGLGTGLVKGVALVE